MATRGQPPPFVPVGRGRSCGTVEEP